VKEFRYLEPKGKEEAVELIGKHWGKAVVMAGGTDLLVEIKSGKISPKVIINLKGVRDLDGVRVNKAGDLVMGAMVTLGSVGESELVGKGWPVLSEAARLVGSVQIRNLGTLGGNICRASPSADMIPPLIVLGASARVWGPQGKRVVLLEKFFKGPGETVLARGEFLGEVIVPKRLPCSGGSYLKLSPRKAMDLALVGVAVEMRLDRRGEKCERVKIALGAVAPTAIRAREAERVLLGLKVEGSLVKKAARCASEESRPISDIRGSEAYRRGMVEVMTQRAIEESLVSARKSASR
jgi:carbon-monoxide dehydrogenase medium subunit